jgi:hypothetical protein
MPRLLSLIIHIFISTVIFSQDKQLYSYIYNATECKNTVELSKINERIIELKASKDTLFIKIGVVTNCANRDMGKVLIQNDTIRLSSYSKYDELWDCNCYFEMDYHIFPLVYNTQKIFYEDKFLLESRELYLTKYNNDLLVQDANAFSYSWSFYESKRLKSVIIEKNQFTEIIEFFENGYIKRNVQIFFEYGYEISKTWNEQGDLIEYKNTIIDEYYRLKIFGKTTEE